ncbi:hypothetical protein ACLI4R_00650 [Natrialbaceae archaeon A-chndr2]
MNFATLLTEDHTPGGLALGQSLYENSGFDDIFLHILAPEGLSETSKQELHNLPIQTKI